MKLGVIVASVREGRVGAAVAEWFAGAARTHGAFDVELLDLKTWDLPMLSEPNHPRLQKYTQDKTKQWSAAVAACDAFAIVTPEYNFAAPPALINALDHLYNEWSYKAAGFVSYGGISGGLRSVQHAKAMLTTFKIVPMVEAVAIPFIGKLVEGGVLAADEKLDKSAAAMLDEIARWTKALNALRQP
ncbi:MAG: NAD(P)H-dependent oxidoreductase [Acidobacteriota bacterium]|nr:NAD(P)H-dependent oxidoreductase [Acidobacteriota bacterium]